MKARNIALIGLGLLAVGGGMLYFLKKKGVVGQNTNSDEGVKILTQEELAQLTIDPRRFNQPIEVRHEMPPEVRAQLERLNAFSGIENLMI